MTKPIYRVTIMDSDDGKTTNVVQAEDATDAIEIMLHHYRNKREIWTIKVTEITFEMLKRD